MTIEHSVITDPYIHEPKGIAAAAANKVYVSDGAASGAWTAFPTKYYTITVPVTTTGSFQLAAPVSIAGTLTRVDWACAVGTSNFNCQKNASNITGLTALTFTGTTVGSDTSFNATTVVAGDSVGIAGSGTITSGVVTFTISY